MTQVPNMIEFFIGVSVQWLANASMFAVKTIVITAAVAYLLKRL